ncbi:hypothetical protein BGZ94_003675, partial [Podila epigama]
IPSIALVCCFNITPNRAKESFRINSPTAVRFVYTAIYSLYAILGLFVAFYLRRLPNRRRFKTLICIYWILITCTIVEGFYFGIMLSKLKSKLVSYCDTRVLHNGSKNYTRIVEEPASAGPNPSTCHRNQALFVVVFYVLGPGGWLLLHIGWILTVVLYSKALRKCHPPTKDTLNPSQSKDHSGFTSRYHAYQLSNQGFIDSDPMSTTRSLTDLGQAQGQQGKDVVNMGVISTVSSQNNPHLPLENAISIGQQQQQKCDGETDDILQKSCAGFQRAINGLRFNFKRTIPSDQFNSQTSLSNKLQLIDSDDNDDDRSSTGNHTLDLERGRSRTRTRGTESSITTSGTPATVVDIPADGRGWWLRQLEGRKRGEFCPCMSKAEYPSWSSEQCWCGKERSTGHSQSSITSSSRSGPLPRSPSPVLQRPLPSPKAHIR